MVEVIAQAVSKEWEDVPLGGAANGADLESGKRTFAAKGPPKGHLADQRVLIETARNEKLSNIGEWNGEDESGKKKRPDLPLERTFLGTGTTCPDSRMGIDLQLRSRRQVQRKQGSIQRQSDRCSQRLGQRPVASWGGQLLEALP